MKMLKKLAAVSAAAMLMLLLAVPALAAGKLELSTKYTGIYAKPGDTLNFDLDFSNLSDSGQNVKLSAAGLPEHWIGRQDHFLGIYPPGQLRRHRQPAGLLQPYHPG